MNNRRLISLATEFLSHWNPDHQHTASGQLEPILSSLEPKHRPKLTATVSGLLRRKLLLEYLLEKNSSVPFRKIHPRLKALLLVAIFQLLFDKTVPDHAVLHATVSLCTPHHRPFANGILRTLVRTRSTFFESVFPQLPLEIKYSFPKMILDHLSARFPSENLSPYLDYLNTEPVFHTVAIDDYIHNSSSSATRILSDRFLMHINQIERIRLEDSELQQHKTLVQNISSQFVSYLAVSLRPRRILDLCAAPGSKSALAALMDPHLDIVANDISTPRLKRFQPRIAAQANGFKNISLCCGDAQSPPYSNNFDLVLLDAPCSALGTIRKHPDRRYDVSQDRIKELSRRQYDMIRHARNHFSHAYLLYSVCTFTLEETSDLIREILMEAPPKSPHFDKTLMRVSQALKTVGIPFLETPYGCYILPDKRLNTDLFFISLFPPVCPLETGE